MEMKSKIESTKSDEPLPVIKDDQTSGQLQTNPTLAVKSAEALLTNKDNADTQTTPTDVDSMAGSPSNDTKYSAETQKEMKKRLNKYKEHYKKLSRTDFYILCAFVWFLLALTLISSLLVFSTSFRQSNDLPMDRSSYWWYFLLCLIIFIYICYGFQVVYRSKSVTRDLVNCPFLMAITIAIIEGIVLSRFFLVTFPMHDINRRVEPILFLLISLFRIISFIISIYFLSKYR